MKMSSRRRAPVLAVAVMGLTLAGAGVAGAHPGGGHFAGGHHGARGASCQIAPGELVPLADSAALTRIDKRLTALVDAGRISVERKDRIFSRRQKQITLRTERVAARTAPVLALLGMTAEELKAARKDRALRAILKDKKITRQAFRTALREGRVAAREKVAELCASAAATPAPAA